MATKSTVLDHSARRLALTPCTGPYRASVWTTAERLQHIEALAQQVDTYVQFICHRDRCDGASVESREKAIAAFYEQMVIVERELGRIHHEFKLA